MEDTICGTGLPLDAAIVPWDAPDWLDDAAAWIGEHVECVWPVMCSKRRPWSVTARVQAPGGVFWFKELCAGLAFEPTLTVKLTQHVPQYLPDVIAAAGSRMLTVHARRRLAKLKPTDLSTLAPAWEKIVARYAELQIELSAIAALPAPDGRPETLALRFGEHAEQLVAALGNTVPLSLVHLDVHHNNVCIRNGGPVFLDWAGSVIGHPFCGLTAPLQALVKLGAEPGSPEVLRVRDSYLEPWTIFASPRELRRIFTAAYPLGLLCRVAVVEQMLEPLAPSVRAQHTTMISGKLKSIAEFLRAPDRLGV